MIKFDKPTNLNGSELLTELNAGGVVITQTPLIDGNGDLWLDIAQANKTKAESIVSAHNGTTISPEPTIADKLASVGVSLPDLKVALGL